MTTDQLLQELMSARTRRVPCVLATVAMVRGSVPREAGSKALIYADGRISGSVGGGKLEALVIAEALTLLEGGSPALKTYPLHQESADSFGAVCGGEVTIFLEPQTAGESLFIIGAGHCGAALSRLAQDCGWHVTLVDDRQEVLDSVSATATHCCPAPAFIASRTWHAREALVLVNRNHQLDKEALAAALRHPGAGYVGMMGSHRKIRTVFEELQSSGIAAEDLARVHGPVGLDLDADPPMEIAVSILAEIMMVLRNRTGRSLRLPR
jgi:xanthine dehydrogenase accessory factor